MEQERQRPIESTPAPGAAPDATAGSGINLDAMRQANRAVADAGKKAIHAALSGDSAAFLGATRQRGGQ